MTTDATLTDTLRTFEAGEAKLFGELAPGIYAFGAMRPLGRIRAYSSAGLTPFAGRGLPNEFHLLGHLHLAPDGKVLRVEGFNGAEGERWAKQAGEKVRKADLAAATMTVIPLTPLRACQHTGIR